MAFCRTTFDKGIALDEHYDGPAYARVDPVQIEQALLNTLINARDALEEAAGSSPRITVEVNLVPDGARELEKRGGDYVRIRIGDNGIGIDGATASRLFEPFFTTKPPGKGTGLGLATTRAIIHEHGGFVTCESEARRGATFSLYVQHEDAAPEEQPRASERHSVRVVGTETILVVDDEPAIRHLVGIMLASAGFTPKIAGTRGGRPSRSWRIRAWRRRWRSSSSTSRCPGCRRRISGARSASSRRSRTSSTSRGTPTKRRIRTTPCSKSPRRRSGFSARSGRCSIGGARRASAKNRAERHPRAGAFFSSVQARSRSAPRAFAIRSGSIHARSAFNAA